MAEYQKNNEKCNYEQVDRESVKHIVLDCPDFMAKEIMVMIMIMMRNYDSNDDD